MYVEAQLLVSHVKVTADMIQEGILTCYSKEEIKLKKYVLFIKLNINNDFFSDIIYLCLEENRFIYIFKQITRLVITFDNKKKYLPKEERINVFTHILSVFNNIHYLKLYGPSESCVHQFSFEDRSPTFFSSTLKELHIHVLWFSDCLYLLDGRFNQLQTLIVTIDSIVSQKSTINNNKVSYFMRIR